MAQMHCDVRHPARRQRLPGALWLVLMVVLGLALAPSAHAAEALGGVEGKVTDSSSHDAVAGIEVCAIVSDFELLSEEESELEHAVGCTETGTGGEYVISGLRAGSYYVAFLSPAESKLDYIAELYNGAFEFSAATQVQIKAGAKTPSIDVGLALGAEIAGEVTDAITGTPLAGVQACAFRIGGTGTVEPVSCAHSEAGGDYTIRGLPSGSFKVEYSATGFEPSYFNEKASFAEAEAISVLAPARTSGIDEALTPGHSSSGVAVPTSKLPPALTTPPAQATLSLLARRITVAAGGYALVKVGCTGSEGCRAKLTLRTTRTVTVKGKRTTRAVAIGTSAALSIAAGKTQTVRIKLDAAARTLLRKHRLRGVELLLVTLGRRREESVALIASTAHGKR
jgi:Carboxypeptidase regulatory-like domain